jgi:hypothetical protein
MPSLSAGAIIFLLIEAAFFGILVHCILKAQRYLGPILSSLSRSLRVSEDLFGDERNFDAHRTIDITEDAYLLGSEDL